MPNQEFTTGCELVEDDPRNFPYFLIEEVGASEVPDYQLELQKSYQGKQPSCVGHAVGKSKSKQESNERNQLIDLNKMILYSLCKREQGYQGWGTNVPLAIKILIKYGTTLTTTIPEDTTIPEEEYIRTCLKMTPEQWKEAEEFKAKSFWVIYTGDWQRVLRTTYNEQIPPITTTMWYESYNRPEADGRLPLPSGNQVGGHAFVQSGKETVGDRVKVWFDNSWGEGWGKNGRFYIWLDEIEKYNLGTFFYIIDIERTVADILVKYQGKLIGNNGKPEYYFVSGKDIIHIKDEQAFYLGREQGWWGDWNARIEIPETILKTKTLSVYE